MKIGFIDEVFYPFVGGGEVFIREVGKRLVKKGHSVEIDPGGPDSCLNEMHGFFYPIWPKRSQRLKHGSGDRPISKKLSGKPASRNCRCLWKRTSK